MMHCGFESTTIFEAMSSPRAAAKLVRSGAVVRGGITAG
jgi:hypothetical protein